MANTTYIDQYINDGYKATLSLRNIYDTILVGDENDDTHIFRIPYNDFFLKYKDELESCKQYYTVPETMYYNPKLLSFETYGTTELWIAILRANNMKSVAEFHYPLIQMYNPDRLKELIKVFFKREGKF